MITIFARPLTALQAAARTLAGLATAGILSAALIACGQGGSDAPPSTTVGGAGTVAPAAAPPPQQEAEPLPGTWSGWLQFEGGDRADYSWTFRNDGTFVTSFGTYGTWTQNGPQVSWRFNDPPNTVYNGTLSNGRISGTMTNSSGNGVFEVARGAAAPAAQQQQQASSLAGAWSGYWVVTGGEDGKRAGERMNVSWSFSQSGDFLDGSGKRVGSWSQSGNQIQFSFDNSTLFKGTISGNRVSGTFALPQGGGVYGDFELTR